MRLISNLAVLLLLPVATFADTHYVSLSSTNPVPPFSDWSTAATNVQEAIDVATDGDTVLVTNGTYVLTGTVNVSNGITLVSVNGPTNTILDGNGSVSTCMQVGNSNAVVSGFTVAGGRRDLTVGMSAAGVKLVAGELDDCLIISNQLRSVAGHAIAAAGLLILGGTSGNTRVIANEVGRFFGSAVAAGGICCVAGVARECDVVGNAVELSDGLGQAAAGVLCQSGGVVRSCMIASNLFWWAWCSFAAAGVVCADGGLVENCHVEMNVVNTAYPFTAGGVACAHGGLVQDCCVEMNVVNTAYAITAGGLTT